MLWKVGTGRPLRKATEGRVPAAIDPTGVDRAATDRVVVGRIVIVEAAVIEVDRFARRLLAESPLPSKLAGNPPLRPLEANSNRLRLVPQLRITLQRIWAEKNGAGRIDRAKTARTGIARVAKRLPQPATVAHARTWLRLQNRLRLAKNVLVEEMTQADAASGVIGLFAKSGPQNRIRSSKEARAVSRTICSIAWPRRNRHGSPSRIEVEGMLLVKCLVTGMRTETACHRPRKLSTISSWERKMPEKMPEKEPPKPTSRAVPVADVVDEVAEPLGIARSTRWHRWSRKRSLMTNRWPRTTMVSDRVWPRHAALRNAVRRLNGQQRIVVVRTEGVLSATGLIAGTGRSDPRKTQPAAPNSALAGTETKALTAHLRGRSGVRVTQRIGPLSVRPFGMKVAGISRVASPLAASPWAVSQPVGAVMRKSKPLVRIAEVAMTDLPAMTEAVAMIAPHVGNPPTGGAMPSKPSPLVGQFRVPIVANATSVRLVGNRPNVVARANRRGPPVQTHLVQMLPVQTLLARIALTATAMTDPLVGIGTSARPAATRLPVQIVARRNAHRETPRAAPNRARHRRPATAGTTMTSNPMTGNRLVPSRRRSTPRLGNTPSPC